ncbi:uncharacterized protein LOC126991807 [Eriocheir sinensis]|uniref:uncharacterized protein LOC126991807 n=1 Tax=Eriocheir sinensis TaxID=95602 RepID=UPI0021C6B319|nr:uncharacterized protein LOC126991807 [Eriocheir sinensis]
MYVLTGNQESWTPASSHRQKMAAFTESVVFRLKLLRVLETAGQKVLTYTLLCGTPGKDPSETLVEYLARLPDTSTAKYKNIKEKGKYFDKTQKPMINSDPSCSNFDISLLSKAITVACEGWDDTSQLARLVKMIKDTRNDVVHETHKKITKHAFLTELTKLQKEFDETLDATMAKYNTDGVECDKKRKEVEKHVRDIRDESLSEDEVLRRSLRDLLPHFRKEADEELKQRLDRATLLDPLRFLNRYEQLRVDVTTIFSEIIIEEEKKNIHYSKLLTLAQNSSAPASPHLILIEGDAGSGKTTLLTYTLSNYLKEESDRHMEGLGHYHLLLWVVCREKSSLTLKDLIDSLLPGAYARYSNLLMPLLKYSRVLFLIDGLDEMNDDSLVRDILSQAKDCPNFTLLSTSRPEAIEGMKAMTPKEFKVSHLKLEGVSVDMRTELALKHYRWLCGTKPVDEARLRQVMQELAWSEIFRMPLNILFLVTLFHIEPQKLTTKITQTELYQKILDWCVAKLRHRLAGCPGVPKGPLLGIAIKRFLLELYKIALQGLLHSKLYLSDGDLEHLAEFCDGKGLPLEDTLSAFYSLRRVGTAEQYHAPHKGLQDFFAACHIHGCFSNNYNSGDIRKELHKMAGQNLQLGPLRNMLCHLLGLLSRRSPSVKAVEETVDLLQASGMKNTNDWLSVLAETEPDLDTMLRVAHHIDRDEEYDNNYNIFVRDGTVNIATLLLPHIRRRKVNIDLTRDHSGMEDLLAALHDHKLDRLYFNHHYKHPRPDAASAPLLQQAPW